MIKDPTERFTDRAAHYVRSRPGYPPELLGILQEACGLTPEWVVADVGSGTGLLTVLFLEYGCQVFGVEPNAAMRAAGEDFLRPYVGFTSVAGRSEATSLPAASVDLVTVAQALHWFEPEATSHEFARILRPDGCLAVIRNNRLTEASPLMATIRDLVDDSRERPAHGAGWWDLNAEVLAQYFGPDGWQERTCHHEQVLAEAEFYGLWQSRSTMPRPGTPEYEPLMACLREVFAAHQRDGRVTLHYETRVQVGRIRR